MFIERQMWVRGTTPSGANILGCNILYMHTIPPGLCKLTVDCLYKLAIALTLGRIVGNAKTSERSDACRNADEGKGCDPIGVEYSWL